MITIKEEDVLPASVKPKNEQKAIILIDGDDGELQMYFALYCDSPQSNKGDIWCYFTCRSGIAYIRHKNIKAYVPLVFQEL